MTENEFRNALKHSVGSTGLSSDRQMKVLARMKGGEAQVRNSSNKMKFIFVLAIVAAMCVTGAVAGSRWGVRWDGTLEEREAPVHAMESPANMRMRAIAAESGPDIVTHVWNMNAQEGDSIGFNVGSSRYAASVDELRDWIEADDNMVWPSQLPEGYTMQWGRVDYECDYYGGHVLQGWETTEDGFVIVRFTIPEEDRIVGGYHLRLANDKGKTLTISMRLQRAENQPYVDIFEDGTVNVLDIEGMSNAMLISSDTENILLARRILIKPVRVNWLTSYPPDEFWRESLDFFNSMKIEISSDDSTLTASDLLAIFGLTAK